MRLLLLPEVLLREGVEDQEYPEKEFLVVEDASDVVQIHAEDLLDAEEVVEQIQVLAHYLTDHNIAFTRDHILLVNLFLYVLYASNDLFVLDYLFWSATVLDYLETSLR